MIWVFVFIIILISVGAIAYPLFWVKMQKYYSKHYSKTDVNKATFWLSALSDLDDDFTLGRITETDYQKQKLILQRSYLTSIDK